MQTEFNLDPNLLENGRRISPKRFSAYFSEKIKFDTNVLNTGEGTSVTASKKESVIFEFEGFLKNDFIIKKKFIVSPEFRINYSKYSKNDASVYQNDSYSLFFNLKNKYEHLIKNKPSSFIFDIEYSKINKDYNQIHKREPYSKSLNFTIGESFNLFNFGETNFKLKRKSTTGTNELISNKTTTISMDQSLVLKNQNLLIGMFEYNSIDVFNDPTTSTNNITNRLDYIILNLIPTYTVGLALTTTFTDTKEMKTSRGTEITLNPTFDISKEISDKTKIGFTYDFSKNISKSEDYKYTKHLFFLEFRYSY